jgi:NifU-like protein
MTDFSFGKKLLVLIENPRCVGSFSKEEAAARGMRLASHREGEPKAGRSLALYLLVDESDGVVADAKFQAFGPPALIGAAESACELALRKNYDQVRRLTAELLDKQVRGKGEESAFPLDADSSLNFVLDVLEKAAEQCMDIPIQEYTAPPMDLEPGEKREYPGWKELSPEKKIAVIEAVIAEDIRPYVELDAGGVQVVRVQNDTEVIIAYQGTCTTCYSATGSTLSAIQEILRTKVHPALIVTPDLALSK